MSTFNKNSMGLDGYWLTLIILPNDLRYRKTENYVGVITYTHHGFVVLDFNENVLFNFGFNLLFF